ncbi:MAG: FkbM family methyltransferase [Gammaproteobacteria bacterium]|nr:FkbM family methyltransferase [Gammaproteobacteria bacterium]
MTPTKRPIAFILASSNHGTLIVNRHDYRMVSPTQGFGVGYQILNSSSFDHEEVNFVLALLQKRRKYFGNGVVALDCGANIGVHTIEWARLLHGWGSVVAFEAQERIFYALAGNIAINNCLNATATLAAVGAENDRIRIPAPNYLIPSSFGSLELRKAARNEFIGQPIDYSDTGTTTVDQITIDSRAYPRVDFIKLDVEGMELEALAGASATIDRCKPQMLIETIKSDKEKLLSLLEQKGYLAYPAGINILAIHGSDPTSKDVSLQQTGLHLA